MQDEKIIEVLLDRFPEALTCAEAREFAAELQIELSHMGALCDPSWH